MQTVFIDLARKAPYLSADAPLGGWLHKHTHFITSKFLRTERRRLRRERIALEMDSLQRDHDGSAEQWSVLSPELDDALQQMRTRDRDVIVLRFFEGQSLRNVGEVLGVSEDAAQKRLSRALDRLRSVLQSRGVSFGATGVLTTTLSSHATALSAPAGLVGQLSGSAWAAATAAPPSTLISTILMMTKAKVIAFSCIVALGAVVTAPLARPRASLDPVGLGQDQSILSPRKVSIDAAPVRRKRNHLQEIWAAEQLVSSDPERALQLCLDGETTDRTLWENLLRHFLPERVEDALHLIVDGRCFRSPKVREEAMAMLIDNVSLEMLTSQAEVVANAGGPGAQRLLEKILEQWASVDPEEARMGALALTNPLRRQHALASALVASADAGSESWTRAYEELSPMLRAVAIEPIFASGSMEEQLGWLNQHLLDNHQWADLVMRAFKLSSNPREAYEIAVRDGLIEDKSLGRSLTTWAAQEDPDLYLALFTEAADKERWNVLRSGLQELMETSPEAGFRMMEAHPDLLDSWSISVLSIGAKTPEHLQQVRTLLDSSEEIRSITCRSRTISMRWPGRIRRGFSPPGRTIPQSTTRKSACVTFEDWFRKCGRSLAVAPLPRHGWNPSRIRRRMELSKGSPV